MRVLLKYNMFSSKQLKGNIKLGLKDVLGSAAIYKNVETRA